MIIAFIVHHPLGSLLGLDKQASASLVPGEGDGGQEDFKACPHSFAQVPELKESYRPRGKHRFESPGLLF